jgi:HNH endonuclease/AP2 domain
MATKGNTRKYGQEQPIDDLTADQVRRDFDYNPHTGQFRHSNPGSKTKYYSKIKGYRNVRYLGRLYRVHRLAWLHFYGEWPDGWIDHKNCVRSDNRIENLRIATPSQNTMNSRLRSDNRCGIKGIRWHQRLQKWDARIRVNGKSTFLGLFDTAEAAHQAYVDAANQMFGEFARAA